MEYERNEPSTLQAVSELIEIAGIALEVIFPGLSSEIYKNFEKELRKELEKMEIKKLKKVKDVRELYPFIKARFSSLFEREELERRKLLPYKFPSLIKEVENIIFIYL